MMVQLPAIGLWGWRARLGCAAILLVGLVPVASGQSMGQSTGQTTGAPHAPAKHTAAPAALPKPPPAAPLVKPKGSVHAEPARKPSKSASKAKATASAKASAPAQAAPAAVVAAPLQAAPAVPAEPAKGTSTGLALPRFAALRSDEVNLRTGPGVRYPIDWVYKRRDLPVEIEREFEVWRLVRDQDGVKGWVHQATLTGRRSFVVTGTERVMRREGSADAAAVARLEPGVVGHIRSCDATAQWCKVQVGDYKGWLLRGEFWGILPDEAIN